MLENSILTKEFNWEEKMPKNVNKINSDVEHHVYTPLQSWTTQNISVLLQEMYHSKILNLKQTNRTKQIKQSKTKQNKNEALKTQSN